MQSLVLLISMLIDIYIWIIIGSAVLSWLVAFNVINQYNNFVRQLMTLLHRLTEPTCGPIRRLLPDLGGIDISPVIVIFALIFARNLMFEYLY